MGGWPFYKGFPNLFIESLCIVTNKAKDMNILYDKFAFTLL